MSHWELKHWICHLLFFWCLKKPSPLLWQPFWLVLGATTNHAILSAPSMVANHGVFYLVGWEKTHQQITLSTARMSPLCDGSGLTFEAYSNVGVILRYEIWKLFSTKNFYRRQFVGDASIDVSPEKSLWKNQPFHERKVNYMTFFKWQIIENLLMLSSFYRTSFPLASAKWVQSTIDLSQSPL